MKELTWWLIPVLIWAATAALWDYRARRLPNALTLGAAAIAAGHLLVFRSSVLGATPMSAWMAGIGALVALMPFYRLAWLGAGDVKMMSAIGLMGGVNVLVTTFVISSVLALPVAVSLFLRRYWRHESFRSKKPCVPQGTFLGLGLILTVAAQIPAG